MTKRPVLVIHNADDPSADLYYRRVLSLIEKASGRHWHMRLAGDVKPSEIREFHAAVFLRSNTPADFAVFWRAKKEGCLTVYDTDDNLLLLHQMIPDSDNPWRRHFDLVRPLIRTMVREADLVRLYCLTAVPSFLSLNSNVVVIPPYHEVTDPCMPERGKRPVVVGHFGTPYKDGEFSSLVPAIERLLDERAPLRFEFFGFVPEALAGREDITRLECEPSYGTFREKLLKRRWNIGLAPLRDLEFNRCKNDTKFREYAASSIAGIYSDMPVYRGSVRDEETGLLVPHDDTDAWYRAILKLAHEEALRQAIVQQAYEEVRSRYPMGGYVRGLVEVIETAHVSPVADWSEVRVGTCSGGEPYRAAGGDLDREVRRAELKESGSRDPLSGAEKARRSGGPR